MRLKDKVSIITGAAQGIGLATALKFAAEGAIVIICDMKPEAVDVAVAQCREAGAQVDVDHRVELLERHLLQPRVAGDAGVVDQHVDAAELRLDGGDHRVDRLAVGDVDREARRLRARLAALRDRGVHRLGLHVADDDDGAFAGELECCCQADALGSAGDDRDLVLESHGGVAFSRFRGVGIGGQSRCRKPRMAGRCVSKSLSAWSPPSSRCNSVAA